MSKCNAVDAPAVGLQETQCPVVEYPDLESALVQTAVVPAALCRPTDYAE